MNTHKCETPDKCLIQFGDATTTLAYYAPIYDGHGRNVNPDRNTTTSHMKCWTCKKEWMEEPTQPPAEPARTSQDVCTVPLLSDEEIDEIDADTTHETLMETYRAIEAAVRRKVGI